MRSDHKHFLVVGALTLLIVLVALFSLNSTLGSSAEPIPAPDFEAADQSGQNFSLSDFEGEVVVLHITNIESPLCVECEKTLAAQIGQLQQLVENKPDVNLITLNVRKNPFSKDGLTLSESWWDAEVGWIWAEDFEPYEIAGKYADFTNFEGGFSNRGSITSTSWAEERSTGSRMQRPFKPRSRLWRGANGPGWRGASQFRISRSWGCSAWG
jgi:cytochrome c-type biogenesis protein